MFLTQILTSTGRYIETPALHVLRFLLIFLMLPERGLSGKGHMFRLMFGPGYHKDIFQHDYLILLCEYKNTKLLKQMSLVQRGKTNKTDFFPL